MGERVGGGRVNWEDEREGRRALRPTQKVQLVESGWGEDWTRAMGGGKERSGCCCFSPLAFFLKSHQRAGMIFFKLQRAERRSSIASSMDVISCTLAYNDTCTYYTAYLGIGPYPMLSLESGNLLKFDSPRSK